jgi:hypothetical protein
MALPPSQHTQDPPQTEIDRVVKTLVSPQEMARRQAAERLRQTEIQKVIIREAEQRQPNLRGGK